MARGAGSFEAFVVEIRLEEDGGLGVVVLRSPAGQGRARLRPPFGPEELDGLGVVAPPRESRQLRLSSSLGRALTPREVGGRLFGALFNGAVRHRFERSRGLVEAAGSKLCVQIEIDLGQKDLTWLHDLPWELLYDAEAEEFLCLSGTVQVAVSRRSAL